ncbi:MAG: T9SS type A sorting domain-containing protein, partial [Ignavibacteria bacterium]|nr:T9SS type A sorting domain-containing protein [Ignavibacteria bacterium]
TVNSSEIEQLNKRLGDIMGNTVTVPATYYPGTIVPAQTPVINEEIDAIGNTRFFTSTRTIKAIGTAIEQRGSNIGKIWAVYVFSANASSPDSMRVAYSTNNGLSWVLYALASMGGTDKINTDDMDVELIEGTTGNKYLWIVYGLRATGGSGKWFTGGAVINLTVFGGTLFAYAWPGDDAAKRYYNISITSDNAYYTSNAYVYLACSFDSLGASSYRINTQKFARCTNPYTNTPAFSYLGPNFWWFSSSAPANYQRTLWTDIAYFRNVNDSLIVSFSGVPDSTTVFFAKANISGTPPTAGFSQKGTETSAYKYAARLASSGTAGGTAVIFNQISGGINYIKYFRASNGAFNNLLGQSALVEFLKTNTNCDVYSRRGYNSMYYAYTRYSTSDSLRIVYLNPLSGGNLVNSKANAPTLLTGFISPKPLFRNVSGDSCFVLFCELGPVNVWAAFGCSGTITGISNPILPAVFSLSQNYPNPFNPGTTIEFSIPKNEFVSLKVFDILGREVATILNEVKNQGSYRIDFNASELSGGVYFYKLQAGSSTDVKKMLLIK